MLWSVLLILLGAVLVFGLGPVAWVLGAWIGATALAYWTGINPVLVIVGPPLVFLVACGGLILLLRRLGVPADAPPPRRRSRG